jgi:hypothetical protein
LATIPRQTRIAKPAARPAAYNFIAGESEH